MASSEEETVEILSDPEEMAALEEARREVATGGGTIMTEAQARARWVKP